MTITYSTSQCQRERDEYYTRAQSNDPRWHEWNLQMLDKWQRRLVEATDCAIELNRGIIESWDTPHLIETIRQQHNTYMVIAALRLLAEDVEQLDNLKLEYIYEWCIVIGRTHDLSSEKSLLFEEHERRIEADTCQGCLLSFEHCTCEPDNDTDAQSAGWKQSNHI